MIDLISGRVEGSEMYLQNWLVSHTVLDMKRIAGACIALKSKG